MDDSRKNTWNIWPEDWGAVDLDGGRERTSPKRSIRWLEALMFARELISGIDAAIRRAEASSVDA
jgi:hypothetical protein